MKKAKPRKKRRIRPSWDDYFLEVAHAISKRATCNRGRSGCVIVKDNQILAAGYVASPSGFPHCDDVGHKMIKITQKNGSTTKHCVRTIHAEQNALVLAARKGVALEGGTVYCRMTPCRVCAMLLINAGIKKVVCEKKYHSGKESEKMFRQAKVALKHKNKKTQKYTNQ